MAISSSRILFAARTMIRSETKITLETPLHAISKEQRQQMLASLDRISTKIDSIQEISERMIKEIDDIRDRVDDCDYPVTVGEIEIRLRGTRQITQRITDNLYEIKSMIESSRISDAE